MLETNTRFSKLHRLVPRIARPHEDATVSLIDGYLSVGLAIDGTAGRRNVTAADLDRWGAELDDLMPLALDNLRRQSVRDGWIPVRGQEGLRIYDAKEGGAAARMLLIGEVLTPAPMAGTVVAVPGPDQLIVVTLDNIAALDSLRVLVNATDAAMLEEDQRLSNQLFWFDGQDWQHLAVQHDKGEVRIVPTGDFMAAIERLAAMDYFAPPVAAEA